MKKKPENLMTNNKGNNKKITIKQQQQSKSKEKNHHHHDYYYQLLIIINKIIVSIKVLVVFTDKQSTSDINKAKSSAIELRRHRIKIITVALGNEANIQELGNYATNEDHLIRAKNSEDPLELGKKIMELAFISE